MRALAILLLVVSAAPVAAQSLYQCVDRRGHVSFTSEPCGPGQKTQKVVDATPERMTPERAAQLEQRRRQDEANSAYLRRLAGHDRPARKAPRRTSRVREASRCQAARARRDETLRGVGLRRTFSLLSELDRAVYEACE
jgi:hypothetical protein